MVFCSLLAYNSDDPRRGWANRCLEGLFRQINSDDMILKAEMSGLKWEDCLPYKVKVIQAALEMASDFACFVDTDILFREGWVKALKDFLKPYNPKEPIVAAFPEWTADGTYDFNEEPTIHSYIDWGGLPVQQPRFYLNVGIVAVSIGAKDFVKEWLEWTFKAKWLHEQNALCYLLHQRDDIKVAFLSETLHHIHPFLPEFEAVVPAEVLAVHAIGSVRGWLWEQLAEGRFEVISLKVAMGDKWRSKKQYDKAMEAYQEAIIAGENLSRAYLGIGACYMALGQVEEAIAAYRQALSLRPDYPEALRQLGKCYELQGDYTTAFDCYRRALRLDPKNPGSKAKIGTLIRKLLRETKGRRDVKVLGVWSV